MEEALNHRGALQTFWSTVRPRLEILHMFQPIQSMQCILNLFLRVYDHLVKNGVFSATHFTFRWHVCVSVCGGAKQAAVQTSPAVTASRGSSVTTQWPQHPTHDYNFQYALPGEPCAPHMIKCHSDFTAWRHMVLHWSLQTRMSWLKSVCIGQQGSVTP